VSFDSTAAQVRYKSGEKVLMMAVKAFIVVSLYPTEVLKFNRKIDINLKSEPQRHQGTKNG